METPGNTTPGNTTPGNATPGNATLGNTTWYIETDVLVVGSGAGALTAALVAKEQGAEALVIEKTGLYGGNSAMSGGVVWLPGSETITAAGGEDSIDDARLYMNSVIDQPRLETRIEAYINHCSKLARFLAGKTPVRLVPNPYYADMYPESPGAKWQYRAHETDVFDGKLLGQELYRQRRQHPQTCLFGIIGWTANEAIALQTRAKGWWLVALKMVARFLFDIPGRLKGSRDRRLVLGGALVGGLRKAMLDRGIELLTNCAAQNHIVENGRVVGMKVIHDGQEKNIRARKGVIISSGGFEKNQAMRDQHLPGPSSVDWSAGNPGNTGEMIERTLELGAGNEFMEEAWWGPVVRIPGEDKARMLILEKNLPGSIIVNKPGKRIVNENSSYTKVVMGMIDSHNAGDDAVPAYFIFDAKFRQRYPFGPMLPGQFMPDWSLPGHVKRWLKKSDTVAGLAAQLGIDANGLEETINNFNRYAEAGEDKDFQRGATEYDRTQGDIEVTPNPCLRSLDRAPYYGVEIFPGELGTKGGIKVDEFARVQKANGEVIEGLYAIGNCSSPVTGKTYPASGSTLGPAMVFGLIAAEHCCSH